MPVEVLIHAFSHGKAVKGTPQDARDGRRLLVHVWGRRETLPNFVVIRIGDIAKVDMDPFLVPWRNDVEFTTVSQGAVKRRWRLDVAPRTVTDFGTDVGISDAVVNRLKMEHGATVVSRRSDRSRGVFDIPLTDFDKIQADIKDIFEIDVLPRRFQFAITDVDTAIAAGGRLIVSAVDVLPGIIDRRA